MGRTAGRVLSLALAACGALQLGPAAAIEGGHPARAGDPLAQATVAVRAASVRQNGRIGLTHCTGVLIASDRVATAAHCVPTGSDPSVLGVFAYRGAKPSGKPYLVRSVARRSGGRRSLFASNDLSSQARQLAADYAVLTLDRPVRGRRPIALARHPDAIAGTLRVAGVGLARGGRSGQLRTTVLRTAYTMDAPRLAVAESGNARICLGDSGGPVVATSRNGAVRLLGLATAVIGPQGYCGTTVVVTPIDF